MSSKTTHFIGYQVDQNALHIPVGDRMKPVSQASLLGWTPLLPSSTGDLVDVDV